MQFFDRLRIWWTAARYGLWLDLYSVPGRVRRDMTSGLKANLGDAARAVGATEAIDNLGSLRGLARAEAEDGRLRSPWLAGLSAAITALGATLAAFFFMSLYYVEGVMDTGVTDEVSSGLFPFLGSNVVVENNGAAGFSFELMPGYMPLLAAAVVFVLVAKPWRAARKRDAAVLA